MTDMFRWVLIAIGALTIVGGLAAYFKDTARWLPAIFVAFGAALCGVANIDMTASSTGVSLKIGQQLATASQANQDVAQKQDAAIQALSAQLVQLTGAVESLRTQTNERLSQSANAAPITVPQLDTMHAAQPQLLSTLDASRVAQFRLMDANKNLQAAIQRSNTFQAK